MSCLVGKEGRREGGRDLLASAMLAVGFASSAPPPSINKAIFF